MVDLDFVLNMERHLSWSWPWLGDQRMKPQLVSDPFPSHPFLSSPSALLSSLLPLPPSSFSSLLHKMHPYPTSRSFAPPYRAPRLPAPPPLATPNCGRLRLQLRLRSCIIHIQIQIGTLLLLLLLSLLSERRSNTPRLSRTRTRARTRRTAAGISLFPQAMPAPDVT